MIKIGIESTAYITDKNYTEGIKKMKEQMQKAVANIARFIALQIEKEFDK